MNSLSAVIAVIVGCIAILGGIAALIRIFWKAFGIWSSVLDKIEGLAGSVRELVKDKEKEHANLREADANIRGQVERIDMRLAAHEQYHMNGTTTTGTGA